MRRVFRNKKINDLVARFKYVIRMQVSHQKGSIFCSVFQFNHTYFAYGDHLFRINSSCFSPTKEIYI